MSCFQINSAPKNIEDQEIPRKLQMISKLKTQAKAKKIVMKKSEPKSDLLDSAKHMGHEMRLPGMKKDLRPIPVFQQQPGEKERQFFRRMNQTVTVIF